MARAYLTIDDAPSDTLPAKLDALRARDIPAIFFCEGRRLEDHPDHARRVVEAGYHLGNHGYSHARASDLSVEAFREEVTRTEELIEEAYDAASTTRPARLFRFPYGDEGGENAPALQEVLAERGFLPPDPERITYDWYREDHAGDRDWFWTISVGDWEVESREALAENLAESADRLASDSADVILFHDGGNSPRLFEDFLDLLSDRGVAFGDPLDLATRGPLR